MGARAAADDFGDSWAKSLMSDNRREQITKRGFFINRILAPCDFEASPFYDDADRNERTQQFNSDFGL
jgi:hypothetical protein